MASAVADWPCEHLQLAMKACPYRKDFYAKLGDPQDVVEAELEKWLAALEKIIAQLEAFYVKGGQSVSLLPLLSASSGD